MVTVPLADDDVIGVATNDPSVAVTMGVDIVEVPAIDTATPPMGAPALS
jgi:hypothetical protein